MDIKNLRLNYTKDSIDFHNLTDNPIEFFKCWFSDALELNKYEANACILSTISSSQEPNSRVVLLKGIDNKGFIFFTNYESTKGNHIEYNNSVALNFYWPALERQVRINGIAKKITEQDSDTYFKSRPRGSQIGAWVSQQSKSIMIDDDLISSLNELEVKFKGQEVNRPKNWGGYCIIPKRIEFWQGRESRLHDRLVYEITDGVWKVYRLAP